MAEWRPGSLCTRQACRQAWARNKQGSSPASCSRPRPHRTARACYQCPQTYPQVRAAGPPRQAFPAVSILHLRPLLCRAALYLYVLTSVIPSAFCQRYPRYCGTLTCRCFASGTKISSHACMRSAALRSPTPPRYSNTKYRCICPSDALLCSASNTNTRSHARTDTPHLYVSCNPT